MMTPNIKIDKNIIISPTKQEALVFNRESVGTSFLVAETDGWECGEDETLHMGFETENNNPLYTVSPIAMTYDFESGLYYVPIPEEVLAIEGDWKMQCQKRYGWNEETGLYDYCKAGSFLSFQVQYGIRNINGTAVSKADYASLHREVLDLRNKVSGVTDLNLKINGVPLVGDKSAAQLSLLSSVRSDYKTISLLEKPGATGGVPVLSGTEPYIVPLEEISTGRFRTVASTETTDDIIVGNYIFKEIK